MVNKKRNVYKPKPMTEGKRNIIQGMLGGTELPQDRQSTFEPSIVPKRKKDISGIEDKIISMYAKGMTTTQISEMVEDIYGFEISEGMVSDITDKLLTQIEEWQNRPLSDVYPIVFIDAQILAGYPEQSEKPWSKRYPHPLLRWAYRTEGSRPDGISGYRASALYRTYGKEHSEICSQQGHESICKRLKDNLHCAG